MIKLKELLNEESAMKAIINAKKGAKASGGGYSSWIKISNNYWKNKKTGRLAHNAGLYDRIGEFSDFVIEGKLTERYTFEHDPTDSRFHKEIEHFLAELLKAIKGSKNPKAKSLASRVKSAQGIAKKFTDIVGVRGGHPGGALGRNEGKLNEDYSQRARNFRVNLRTRLKAMKKNETVGIGKMIFSKMVDGNFQITKTGKVFGLEEVVQAIQKGPARPYIKTHRGAAGADMVNAYVKFGK